MTLERLLPYRIMRGSRMKNSLGEIPNSAKGIFGYYFVRAEDAKRVVDAENQFRLFIKSVLREAEKAKMKASYSMYAEINRYDAR